MIIDNKLRGLVTKKFNDFFLVNLNQGENLLSKSRFLCKIRKSVNFRNQNVYVGDEVILN